MSYGTARFLDNNYINSVDRITADTQATGRGQLMELVEGSGSAIPYSAVQYTGDTDRTITLIIDSVSAGHAVGQATYKWRYDDSSGWEATGVSTSGTLTTLGLGIQVAWGSHETENDFELDDRFELRVRADLGTQNLFDGNPNTLFESTAVDNLVFDLDSALNVTAFAMLNHNLVAGQSTFHLEANSADSWGSPAYDNTLTVTNTNQIEYLNETYRYWQTDPTDGALSKVSCGEMFLGSYTELSVNAYWQSVEGLQYLGYSQESQWGILNQQGIAKRRTYSLHYDRLKDVDIALLITMQETLWNSTTGKMKPLFVHFDSSDTGATLILAHWVNWRELSRTHRDPNFRGIPDLIFQEIPITSV